MLMAAGGLLGASATGSLAGGAGPVAEPEAARQFYPSSRATGLIISELHYHPADSAVADLEFIELYNTDPVAQDLSGYRVDGDVSFTFPAGTRILARSYLVLAHQPAAFQAFYGVPSGLGPYEGKLNDTGGTVRLLNRRGTVLLEIPFDERAPWPSAAAGAGHSLVLTAPDLGEADPLAWAASAELHGNPGRANVPRTDGLTRVALNEIGLGADGFVEIFNRGTEPQDLAALELRPLGSSKHYSFPPGTLLPAHQLLAIPEHLLGFPLKSERLLLARSDGTGVVDVWDVPPLPPSAAWGLSPDGQGEPRLLSGQSAGANNLPRLVPPVVINEIMFHPLSDREADDFIELYNRSAETVDLSHWRFTEGVAFQFPAGTRLSPGGYLVIAKDRTHLLTTHPDLDPGSAVGIYDGTLSNRGELLTLSRPLDPANPDLGHIAVNSVRYADTSDWGEWADGDGSSLELVDADSDNRLAMNWQSSDESTKSSWTPFEATGRMLDSMVTPSSRIYFWLPHRGEALIDNVEVITGTLTNIVRNGDFAETNRFWSAWGNHALSRVEPTGGIDGTACYHLRSQAAGGLVGDKLLGTLSRPITNRSPVTLRFQARWLAGSPRLLMVLKGLGFELSTALAIPTQLGTPGARNSRALSPGTSPAALSDLAHDPILPAAGEPVVITCRRESRDGAPPPVLEWKLDAGDSFNEVEMRDDGQAPDAHAGDGCFAALLPGQARDQLVVYRVVSRQGDRQRFLPWPGPHGENLALVRFGEQPFGGDFGDYRIWMRATNVSSWNLQPKMCNQLWPATFVWNDFRAIHGAGVRFSGSGFSRPGYTHPITGVEAGYVFHLPDHSRHRGDVSFKMDSTNPGQDNRTYQRTKLSMALGNALRAPVLNTHYVHWFMNGVQRGRLYTDAQTPNSEWIRSQFPEDADGYLHEAIKAEDYDDQILSSSGGRLPTFGFLGKVDGAYAKNTYRAIWERKDQGPRDDSFAELFRLYDTMNLTNPVTQSAAIAAHIEVDEFVRVLAMRHLSTDQDGFGYNDVSNAMLYKSPTGKWNHIPWDFDTGWGVSRDPQDLLPPEAEMAGNDQRLATFFGRGLVIRAYWRAVLEGSDWLSRDALTHLDSWNEVLTRPTNGVTTLSGFAALRGHASGRATFVKGVLASKSLFPNLAITNYPGPEVSTHEALITLRGLAPINMVSLHVNGQDQPAAVLWTSVRSWELTLPLEPGRNDLVIDGRDAEGRKLESVGLRVTSSLETAQPPNEIVIHEILAFPAEPGAEFLELHNTSSTRTIQVGGLRVEELDYTIPKGTLIPPQGFLCLAQQRSRFATVHGVSRMDRVVGDFPNRFSAAGGSITLLDRDGVTVIDQASYGHDAPWPAAVWDGTGASLQRVSPSRPANALWNWVAATPTPALANTVASPSEPPPSLQITEIQSSNTRTLPDPSGHFVPWLELLNAGEDATLANCYLSDDPSRPARWPLPAEALVRAGQRLLIWCDGRAEAGVPPNDLHAPFTLKPTGGMVLIAQIQAGVTNILHFLRYPGLAEDRSFGLTGQDGLGEGAHLATPTPGGTNTGPGPEEVRINEWMADNRSTLEDPSDHDFEDWVELYNPGDAPVNLEGWSLSEEAALIPRWAFPAGAAIPPKGYLVLWADNEAHQRGLHATFKLSSQGESLFLIGPNGAVVDQVRFGPQQADVSEGRTADGRPHLGVLPHPSPGGPNRSPANHAPVVNTPVHRVLYAGETVSFTVAAGDPDFPPQPVQLRLESPSNGASFDPATGLFSWTPSVTTPPGLYEFLLEATDSGNPPLRTLQGFGYTLAPPLSLGLEVSNRTTLTFLTLSNRAYSVDWREGFDYGRWLKLTNLTARTSNRVELLTDPNPAASQRLYRVVTPPSPDRPPGPVILRSPRSAEFIPGERVEFNVFASGTGTLRYQWYFGGQLVPGATRSNLVLEAAQPEEAGAYTVTVSNSAGVATNEPPAELWVRP